MQVDLAQIALLFLTGLIAGAIDAVAGGGGLIAFPVLLLTGVPPHLALGTNKGQSVIGTGFAIYKFYRSHLLDKARARIYFLPAFLASGLGVLAITRFSNEALKPLIVFLLLSVAVTMLFLPARLSVNGKRFSFAVSLAAISLIAFYDGFFGPGTGVFLIMAHLLLFKDKLDVASANAKIINFASNLAAVLIFSLKGLIVWKLVFPMALGQALGGSLGAHFTIKNGARFVRFVVVIISMLLVLRLSWDWLSLAQTD